MNRFLPAFPKAAKFVVTCALLLSIPACRQEDVASRYYLPGIDAISFEGIPKEDVALDRLNGVITVTMPSMLSKTSLKPKIALREGAKVTGGLNAAGEFDISDYCPCSIHYSPYRYGIDVDLANGRKARYEVKFKAKGPLVVNNLSSPYKFSIKHSRLDLEFPVENLYGNGYIIRVGLKEVNTAKVIDIAYDGTCMTTCPNKPNTLGVHISDLYKQIIPPGTYKVEFLINDFYSTYKTPNSLYTLSQNLIITE